MAEYVQFPTTSAPVSMIGSDDRYSIVGFFGPIISGGYARTSPANPSLREYIKGGSFVPNVAQNSGVPASGDLDMLDLLGAYAALEITSMPEIYVMTIQEDFTAFKYWYASFTPTFRPGVGGSVNGSWHTYKHAEYKWVHSLTFDDGGSPDNVNLSAASDTGYSAGQMGKDLSIRARANGSGTITDCSLDGTITLYARSLIDPTKITSQTCAVHLSIIGTA